MKKYQKSDKLKNLGRSTYVYLDKLIGVDTETIK